MYLPSVVVEPKWHTRTTRMYAKPGEIEILLTLANSIRPRPRSMIEFGVNIGLTAKAVLDNLISIERYVGIDVSPMFRTTLPSQQSEVPAEAGLLVKDDPRFQLFLHDATYNGFPLAEEFDVAYIDGDHSQAGVVLDYNLSKSLVRRGGIIIFHDYGNPNVPVTETLDRLFDAGADIRHVENTWLAYERIL